MFGTIRRHQTWLWAVIATLTVISFVYFFNPNTKYAGRGAGSLAKADLGRIDGEPVSREQYYAALQEAELGYFMNHGVWPDRDPDAKRQGYDEQRQVYERLFLEKRAKDFGIRIGQAEVQQAAGRILLSLQGRNPEPPSLEEFAKQVLEPRGMTTGDLSRYLEDSLAIQNLINALGQGGRLLTPQEAEMLYRHENEQLTTEAAFFEASNYLDRITVDPVALGTFFTNQMANYRLPDRVQVSYVKFPAQDYWVDADATIAKNTNFELQVDSVYRQRGTNYYGGTSVAVAKDEIRKEFRNEIALQAADKAAKVFAEALSDLPEASESLATLAARSNLTVGVTAPFSLAEGPAELNVPPEFARFAFKLSAEEPVAGPVRGEDAVYMIALKQQVPSEIPSFESIHGKVAADYQRLEATLLARQAGTNFAAVVSAGVAKGKTFEAIAAEANVPVVKVPPFGLSTRALPAMEGHINFGRLQDVAYGLPAGYTSPFVPTQAGGLLLHMVSRAPASDEKLKEELPAFMAQMRQTRANEAFQAWLMRESQTGLKDTPLARQQQAQQP